MPKIPRVELLDDIAYGKDGKDVPATEERTFMVSGQQYHTYLSAEHAKEFDASMAEWTTYAERVSPTKARKQAHSGGGGGGGGSAAARRPQDQSARIRAWALTQKFNPPVSDRGRIPGWVIQAYHAANPEDQVAS